jgi:uncharacterized repeat protein (TIGR04138 family)
MSKLNFSDVVNEICRKDSLYDPEVYSFVREGLDHTLKSLKRHGQNGNRHVSGQELLNGLRDYALKEYGPMSKMLLNMWGVKSCEDFGRIVFNLVSSGVLGKTDTDSQNDFKNGFNFDDAFVKPFEPRRDNAPAGKTRRSTTAKKRPGNNKHSSTGTTTL